MEKTMYAISVGEPWDFESIDGQNLIKGVIINKLNNKCLIFKTNEKLQFGDIIGDILILTLRQVDRNFSSVDKDSILINGSLIYNNYSFENKSESELLANSKFVIVGSIRCIGG